MAPNCPGCHAPIQLRPTAHQLTNAHTVQAHLRSIYSKLGVTTRTAAARYALTHGLG